MINTSSIVDSMQNCTYADLVQAHTLMLECMNKTLLANHKLIAKVLFKCDRRANELEVVFAIDALEKADSVEKVNEIVQDTQRYLAVDNAFFRYAASVMKLNQKNEFVDPHRGWESSKSSE